jgi:NADPH:quinone reductase-like Zn-dependent oxidoreductase
MTAAVHSEYGEPSEVVSLSEVPLPSIDEDEVLVRVHAAGVNWADWSMTMGTPYVMRLGYGLTRPRNGIRGTDVAGAVAEVGSAVSDFAPGDEVFGWCTEAFAQFAAVAQDQLVSKPATLSFEQAAGLPLAGCVALQAVRDIAGVQPGDHVLVVGASGGIGSLTVQIAKAYGAHVTGVCSTTNLDFVSSLGAERVIDYTHQDFTLGDARYDMILDMADKHSLSERRRVLHEHGTLIPNSGRGGRWIGSLPRIFKAWAVSPFVSQRLRPFLSMAKREDLAELVRLVEDGAVSPAVGSRYALNQTGAAIAEAGSGHARAKVVIAVDPAVDGVDQDQ